MVPISVIPKFKYSEQWKNMTLQLDYVIGKSYRVAVSSWEGWRPFFFFAVDIL